MATPYQNPSDAYSNLYSAFKPTTDAQRSALMNAAKLVPTLPAPVDSGSIPQTTPTYTTSGLGGTSQTNFSGGAITPAQMSPEQPRPVVTPINTGTPDTSSVQTTLSNSEKIINDLYGTPLPNESQQNDLRTQIMSLTGDVSQEASRRAQLEADPALQAKRQQVQDLTAQANALIAESKAIPIRIQQEAQQGGAIVTKGGLAPIQTAQLRNNAIQALSVGSLLSAAQGNLTLALDQVDRAVKAEFEPKKAELAAKRANLEMLMNDPALTREEKRRGAIAEARLKAEEDRVKKEEAEKTAVYDIGVKAAQLGATGLVLKAIQSAKTKEEAMQIATDSGLFIPKPNYDTIKLDNGETVIWDKTTGKFVKSLGGAKTKELTQAEQDALDKQTQGRSQTLQGLQLVNDILKGGKNPLFNVFGAGRFNLYSLTSSLTGAAPQYLKNQVQQLRDVLSLDNRSKLKGSGAISDFEAKTLARAATALDTSLSVDDAMKEMAKIRGVFQNSAGLPAQIKIRNPKTGESAIISATREGVEGAIADGMIVEYQ